MKLAEYIKDLGAYKFAELYEITPTQAYKLMAMDHAPEPKLAYKVVKYTHGLVTWPEIYEPVFEKKQEDDAQIKFDL